MTAAEKIKHYTQVAQPGRCITCGDKAKKGELQCDYCKRNIGIKDDKKDYNEKQLLNSYKR